MGRIIERMFVSGVVGVGNVLPLSWVPVVGEALPAGWPSPAQDYFDGEIDLNEHLIEHRTSTFIARVSGDSMTGVGICDGDEVIVDRALTPVDGDTVVAVVDGEHTIKTLRLTATGPELHPENAEYPVLRPRSEDLMIWGVVTTCLHHLRK